MVVGLFDIYWDHHRLGVHCKCLYLALLRRLSTFLQVLYSLVSPSYAVTLLYGNYYFLFTSAYFWLSIPLTFFLSLLPRYLVKAWKSSYAPDDIETIQYIVKTKPDVDFSDVNMGALSSLKRTMPSSVASRLGVNDSQVTLGLRGGDLRAASRTDMATGLISVDRGFDFAMEENGVAMRRMQSNLSERRASQKNLAEQPLKGKGFKRIFSTRKKPPSQ